MNYLFIDLGKHYGGAEVYLTSLIDSAMKNKDSCILLVKKDSVFSEKYKQRSNHCTVIEVDFNLKSLLLLRLYIKKRNIDMFHVNGINSGIFRRLLFIDIPTVTTVHSNAWVDRIERKAIIRRLFVKAENYCLKKSTKIIAVSDAIKSMLIERGIENKITVIENGILNIDYPPKIFSTGNLRICFVGRLEKVKGPEILIKALGNVRKFNWTCDIYGDGAERNKLLQLCEEQDIEKKVNFKGFCDNIRTVLNTYDMLIQPSLYEAFSLSLVEAMNARTLIVCSDVGGMSSIVEEGITGFKFSVGDFGQLASIIQKVYEDRSILTEITEQAYQKFIDKYTQDKMLNATLNVFGKVCGTYV